MKAESSPIEQYCRDVKAYFASERFPRRIIYTVLFGDSDRLKQPRSVDEGYEYYCVTDCQDWEFGIWQPAILPLKHRDDRRTARIIKLLPELVFGELEQSIFVDASILIRGSLVQLWEEYAHGAPFAAFRHGERNCSYEEASACLAQEKDDPVRIRKQMKDYRSQGFPEAAGLIASGVLLRNHLDQGIVRLMDCWLRQIEEHSARDQLSFAYAAWKTKTAFSTIPLDIFNNPYVEVKPHSRLRRFDDRGSNVVTSAEQARHKLVSYKAELLHALRRLKGQ